MKPTSLDQGSEGRTTSNPPVASSFGEQLRRAREARGIPLREISEQTRISIRYLEGIEANDYKQLPGGIFNRSFIKAYARYIGFPEKEALEAYTRTAREQGELPDESGPIQQPSRVYLNEQPGRSPLTTWLLTVMVLAILALGVYAALRGYQRRTGGANEVSSAPAVNAPPVVAPPEPSPSPTAGLKVEVSALKEDVWLRVRRDQEPSVEVTVGANTTEEFAPAERLTLQYSKSRAKSLQVKINGRAAVVPAESKGPLAEMVIERGNYESVLQ